MPGAPFHVTDFFMDAAQNFWYVTKNDELIYRDNSRNSVAVVLNYVSGFSGLNDRLYDLVVHDVAHIVVWGDDGNLDEGLLRLPDDAGIGVVVGVVHHARWI